jgi:hypothetical protein
MLFVKRRYRINAPHLPFSQWAKSIFQCSLPIYETMTLLTLSDLIKFGAFITNFEALCSHFSHSPIRLIK